METTLNERLLLLLKTIHMSEQQLAVKIKKSPSTIYRILKDESSPTDSTIQAIADATNSEFVWLKHGIGDIQITPKSDPNTNPWQDAAFSALKDEVRFLKKQTEWLQNLVNNLSQTGAKASFNIVSDVAEIPSYLFKGIYSGAYAQQTGATA